MPIGASKVGALGGLVPGGSETFNASGTFSVPPGVKIVSITGVGGTGNPGNSGTAGNPGNIGFGGGGGGGGSGACNFFDGTKGGPAWSATPTAIQGPGAAGGTPGIRNAPTTITLANPGQQGQAGSAGSAGTAGNPGNTGQSSSGLGNNFAGGAGGNAGAAGNAGNGGSGGQGGTRGLPTRTPSSSNCSQGGAGGNGGGAGTPGHVAQTRTSPTPIRVVGYGGTGGGGAGATNDGASGTNTPYFVPPVPTAIYGGKGGLGGSTSNYSVPLSPTFNNVFVQSEITPGLNTSTTGGPGLSPGSFSQSGNLGNCAPPNGRFAVGANQALNPGDIRRVPNQPGVNIFCYSPNQAAFNAVRSGGGGGAGGKGIGVQCPLPFFNPTNQIGGGGGGGGGRGNAGNAGGAGGAGGTGSAGTPQTFNCVPVTPGCSYPITVGSPGGQVVISWNPQ